MTTPRDPFTVLQSLSARESIDHDQLARARVTVDQACMGAVQAPFEQRARTNRRPGRVLAVAGVSFAALAVTIVLPLTDSTRPQATTPPIAQYMGVLPAAAVGHGCPNEKSPFPGLSDPDEEVTRDLWDSLPPVRQILHLVDERSPEIADVTSGPAVCDAVPIVVLHDEAGQRGIVVFRDVTQPFLGATNLEETVVRGYSAQVLSPPAGHHYLSWTDGEGVRWFAEASGVSVEELASTLTASLDETGLVSVPDGFNAVPIPVNDPDATLYRWSVQYDTGRYVYLEVTTPARAPVETLAARPLDQQYTTVGDARAVYLPSEQGGAGIRWATDEASYRLVVDGADLRELREMAEGLEHVPTDDPRLP